MKPYPATVVPRQQSLLERGRSASTLADRVASRSDPAERKQQLNGSFYAIANGNRKNGKNQSTQPALPFVRVDRPQATSTDCWLESETIWLAAGDRQSRGSH